VNSQEETLKTFVWISSKNSASADTTATFFLGCLVVGRFEIPPPHPQEGGLIWRYFVVSHFCKIVRENNTNISVSADFLYKY
jgi:hypothetical protein